MLIRILSINNSNTIPAAIQNIVYPISLRIGGYLFVFLTAARALLQQAADLLLYCMRSITV